MAEGLFSLLPISSDCIMESIHLDGNPTITSVTDSKYTVLSTSLKDKLDNGHTGGKGNLVANYY